MVTFILLLPVLVYSSHVVLHAGFCDKILRAFVGRTQVWFFPTVMERMSGELMRSAKALVAVLTGERFLK